MELWLCWLFFVLAVVCFAVSLVFCALKFRRNKITVVDSHSVVMFVSLYFSCFFIMFFSGKDVDNVWLNIAETLLLSTKLFHSGGGGGTFALDDATLNTCYQVFYYVLAFYAPVTLIATALSFFGDLINKYKIRRYAKSRNLLVFNELNERNLAIAENFKKAVPCEKEDIYADLKFGNDFFDYGRYCTLERNRKVPVFCDVNKSHSEVTAELLSRANELGGIVLKEDIITLHKFIRKGLKKNASNKLTRYFLSGTDENENVRHAIEIAKAEDADPVKNLAVFTFAEGEANGHIIESLNTHKEFFVRRLSPSAMLAKDVLSEKQFFLVNSEDPEKELKVLVLGLGSYGLEIVKFLCWFYQRQSGGITLYIVDKDPKVKEAISGAYGDFVDYENAAGCDQDACFKLKFYQGVDVFGGGFADVLKQIVSDGDIGLDAVYTALGDDNQNIEASMHVRMLLDRIFQSDFSRINAAAFDPAVTDADRDCPAFAYADGKLRDKVRIFCIVHSDLVMGNVNAAGGFIENSNICFVGADSSVYRCDNIFDAEEEQMSVVANRSGKSVADEALIRFNGSEYIRHSSSAEVVYETFVTSLYPVEETEEYALMRQKVGNKRWNAYMRANGYTCYDVDDDLRATVFEKRSTPDLPIRQWRRGKWHNSIVPFDKLPKKEQENNYKGRVKVGSK